MAFEFRNHDDVVKELAKRMMDFDCALNRYQTDVYVYVEDDSVTEMCEFCNVGGNSWLNDDHYVLYVDEEHFATVLDDLRTDDILHILDISLYGLEKEVRQYFHYDDGDHIVRGEIEEYIFHKKDYLDKITEYHNMGIYEDEDDYLSNAEAYVELLEEKIDRERRECDE